MNAKKRNALVILTVALTLLCATGRTQIIYSNNFSLGGAVNIAKTPPTVANSIAGGTNNATWTDVLGTNNTGALLANGTYTATATLGDSFLLPFVPQAGHVYVLTANVTFTNNPGNWIGLGFAQNNTNNVANGFARFSDNQAGGVTSPRGSDWMILTESSGNVQYFAGPGTSVQLISQNNLFTPGPGTHTAQIILNTISNLWSIAGYVDGVQVATNYTYTSNPTIRGVGMTQNALGTPTAVQWNYLTLSAALQPFITKQPTAQNVAAGTPFTNTVSAVSDANGGNLSYQWYANGVPLTNNASINGANTNVLIINPVLPGDAGSYQVVVTNNSGSATSAVANVTVLVNPVITAQFPNAHTNIITLFGGANVDGINYVGSSPTFSVSALGAQPMKYLWLTNGVPVTGVTTNASFTFTNAQMNSPTNFSVVVTNDYGAVTSESWFVSYVPTPTASYPQIVLAAKPVAYWRLNEQPDNGGGNNGTLATDYAGGNNGIYTNVIVAQPGYNSLEPSQTSVFFGGGLPQSYAGQIQGVDFATPSGVNAQFSVEAWANGAVASSGAPIISKGTYNVSDAFGLGVDSNTQRYYQFYVRSANGTVYRAVSTVSALDDHWHHLAGVCDQAKGQILLYIDGKLAASSTIPSNVGAYAVTAPVVIGAGTTNTVTGYNLQFFGYINDVAAYNYALSPVQVATRFGMVGNMAPTFAQSPPAGITNNAGATLTLSATLIGTPPMGYYWRDVNSGTNVASGATGDALLEAMLTIPNVPADWNGNQLELTVTNAHGSTSTYVNLTVATGAPRIAVDVPVSFYAPRGGTASNVVTAAGSEPFYYQWQFNGNNLTDEGHIAGSQSRVLSIANAQNSDVGDYRVIIGNTYGSVTSSVSAFVIIDNLPIGFNGGMGWTANQLSTAYTTPTITNGILTLTDGHNNQARSFFFSYPQYIGAFKAAFTYQASGTADGMTFCLQNDPRGALALGGIGGSLGVGTNGAQPGIVPSVELELNIFSGNGLGGIGYAFATNGTIGRTTAPNPVKLTNDPVDVSLYYVNGRLAVTFSNQISAAVFSTNLAVGDLTQVLGDNKAYVGFTGSSGGSPAVQSISNFSFVSIPAAAIQVNGANALISWPGEVVGYVLQQNADLTTPDWVTVPNAAVVTNGQNQIIVPAGGNSLFYRLILP